METRTPLPYHYSNCWKVVSVLGHASVPAGFVLLCNFKVSNLNSIQPVISLKMPATKHSLSPFICFLKQSSLDHFIFGTPLLSVKMEFFGRYVKLQRYYWATCTNETTYNFNSHSLKKQLLMRPLWCQSTALSYAMALSITRSPSIWAPWRLWTVGINNVSSTVIKTPNHRLTFGKM